jgi:hypothetical protein
MPRFNNYPDTFSKVIRRRSDNLSTIITPPTQNVAFFVTIRLKTDNTIDSVFTNADFQRGGSAATSDNLRLTNAKTGSIAVYYVRTSDGTWRDAFNILAENVRVQNNSLISIIRRDASSKDYTLKGTAKATTYTPF